MKKQIPTWKLIKCACHEEFKVKTTLFDEACKKRKRDIFCPRGHELSWRGGSLGSRRKMMATADYLAGELQEARYAVQWGMDANKVFANEFAGAIKQLNTPRSGAPSLQEVLSGIAKRQKIAVRKRKKNART